MIFPKVILIIILMHKKGKGKTNLTIKINFMS